MALEISGRQRAGSKPRLPKRGWKKAQAIISSLLQRKESIALLATIRKCNREWVRYTKLAEEMNGLKLEAELELIKKFGISVSDLFYVELAVEMKETEELLKKIGGASDGADGSV